MGRKNYIDIDVSDAKKKIQSLSGALSKREMVLLENRVLRRTAGKVKSIVSTDVPKKYHIKKSVVAKDVKRPIIDGPRAANEGISCSIPIEGVRHIIGGKTFPAQNGRKGWKGIKAGKRYKIKTQIVKGENSILPVNIQEHAGNAPFRNLTAEKLNRAVFVRSEKAGFPPKNTPIIRVTGLAVPQMPMNRAQDEVQNDVREFINKRIDAEFNYIMQKVKK